MNKRGSEELFKVLLGIVLGALVVLMLMSGVSRIYDAIIPSFQVKQENFNGFKDKINDVIKTEKPTNFNLVVSFPNIVFGIGKKSPELILPIDIYYSKGKELRKAIKDRIPPFRSIPRPDSCSKDFACVCKCELNIKREGIINQVTKVSCIKESTSCFDLPDKINEVLSSQDANSLIFYKDNQGKFYAINSPETKFFVSHSLESNDPIDKPISVSLLIKKKDNKLFLNYEP